jgi:alpha-1,2-mannosyltransferase
VGLSALARGDIYAPGPTVHMYVFYLPHFSLLMLPFAALPLEAAAWIWFAVKAAGLVLLVRWARSWIRGDETGRPGFAWRAYVAIPFVLALNPINCDFKLGQVNLVVFLMTLLAVVTLERGRHGLAALFFSVAMVKVTPWVFLPWFLLRRQWRFLASLVAVACGWLGALALWFGPARVPRLFVSWIQTSLTYKMGIEQVAYFENQSLQGVAARLATVWPALQRPVLGVPIYQVAWAVPVAALFAILVVVVTRDRFRQVLPVEEFAFVCVLMLLASPDSRWAHHVQLIAPLVLVAVLAARMRLLGFLPGLGHDPKTGGRRGSATEAIADPAAQVSLRRKLGATVGTGFLLLVVLTRDFIGKPADQVLRAWRSHTLFVVCLTILLANLMLDRRLERVFGRGPGPHLAR